MSNGISVVKRDGSVESLNLDKVHAMVELACEDLAGVSSSQVEMNSGIQFYDGIKTEDIQEILIRSANDLISLDTPNYQYVAARLLLFGLRKAVFGYHPDKPPILYNHICKCVDHGMYDEELLTVYTEEEWEEIQSYVDHNRDYMFTYAGLRQVCDKYLVQDRSTGYLFETPQQLSLIHISEPTRPY